VVVTVGALLSRPYRRLVAAEAVARTAPPRAAAPAQL
jgi:hypothetical protein